MTQALQVQGQVVTAARFYVEMNIIGRIAFSELGGISSKVVSQEYIFNDTSGETVHTKQFGKTEPPTITLKRGLDFEGNNKLLAWHLMARNGDPNARGDGFLIVMDASKSAPEIKYHLHHAWCSEILISGMKAGESTVATIECKITCEQITGAQV
jgi:phage tail-like protein